MGLDELTVYKKIIPAKSGEYVEFPAEMKPELKECLRDRCIRQLYVHQAEMFTHAQNGKNAVITTSTASGKTFGFLLPVLQKILDEPLTRAIFIYPTKALASDQYRALLPWIEFLGAGKVSAGVYDGDTGSAERSRIRKQANIILTNPEMLNSAFLPNHSKYGFDLIFANLKYIVIDELHSYRGAFGSHMANIFRRVSRVCRYYGARPQFLCSSATIANPVELAEKICGVPFELIDRDGAPAPQKEYRIIQPPEIKGRDDRIYGRRSASSVVADAVPGLVEDGHQFIVFAKTRRGVEVILKEARDKLDSSGFLGEADSRRIAGYRGGYTPRERKEIERKMITGVLQGLVSTNALELGIDIGSLDVTVLTGYPGTRASFWQQTGRAGRGQENCTNYLILENQPFDQYIAIDPDWLFTRESENAIVDQNNLLIELAHIRAAASELPLSMDDLALFPDLGEVIPVLIGAEELKSLAGKFMWNGPAYPQGDYSLRNMDESRYRLVLLSDGREITQMDEEKAFHELHPGAVYMHEGALYEVRKLDLSARVAQAEEFDGNYYTVPTGTAETRILQIFEENEYQRTSVKFGDINVNEVVTSYKKLQFHNHQNLGYVTLTVPLQKDYDTESTWIRIPANVVKVYRKLLKRSEYGDMIRNNHFDGISNALKNASMMVTMSAQEDIDVIVSNNALIPNGQDQETVSMFIYDKYEGGLGYSEKIYDLVPNIIAHAIRMVRSCPCKDGCPACVGDYTLDKKMVLWGLENFLEESEAPVSLKISADVPETVIEKEFSFFKLREQWQDFCDAAEKNGDAGSSFFRTVTELTIKGHTLILTVGSEFTAKWMQEPQNKRSLENILRYHAICPADMKLEIEARQDPREKKKTEARLHRRL